MATPFIGARIKALRAERKLSQADLARLFGFKDRQTVSAIENGERRVTAGELLLAVEKLGAPLDYFTDPFLLVGEGRFSWRLTHGGAEDLGAYERRAGRWLAAFRSIASEVGRAAPLLRHALGLMRQSRLEEAIEAGERFAAEFKLGDVPARRLATVMEHELCMLVLMVDMPKGVAAAACRLPALDAVLVNRHEVTGRRHLDLAHQLFHLLTWDAMPPSHVEDARRIDNHRVEQLANGFASAVLMPEAALERHGEWAQLDDRELVAKLAAVADELLVTASALTSRLVALGRLTPARARAIPKAALDQGGPAGCGATPLLFSRSFVDVIGLGIDDGRVSARRAASLLGLTIEDLTDLFTAHGIEPPL